MHFIFGGRVMGMLEFAESLFSDAAVCDLAVDLPDVISGADIVCNIQLLIKKMVLKGQNASVFIERNLDQWHDKIIVGDEVGCGVVPVEPHEREWRDEVGRVYQLLSRHASDVTRVWAGLPQALKRDGIPL